MYTLADFQEAKRKSDEAAEQLSAKIKEQAQIRQETEATLDYLNRELALVQQAKALADARADHFKRRLLGYWEDSYSADSNILTLNGKDRCWDNRVWLRLATYQGVLWEVRIRHPDECATKNIVLGPRVGDIKEDLEANKKKVEKILVEMGYILP